MRFRRIQWEQSDEERERVYCWYCSRYYCSKVSVDNKNDQRQWSRWVTGHLAIFVGNWLSYMHPWKISSKFTGSIFGCAESVFCIVFFLRLLSLEFVYFVVVSLCEWLCVKFLNLKDSCLASHHLHIYAKYATIFICVWFLQGDYDLGMAGLATHSFHLYTLFSNESWCGV